jgi:hypothetical protein
MRTCAKHAPRFFGPFEILDIVGHVAYRLALPPIVKAHNVFHVSMLKKYVHDSNHIIDWSVIYVEPEGEFLPEKKCIIDRKEIPLKNKTISQVKVQWKKFGPDEATWEMEDAMKHAYHFFVYCCTYRAHWKVEHRGRCYFKGEGIVIPFFLLVFKYNYILLKDYGKIYYV